MGRNTWQSEGDHGRGDWHRRRRLGLWPISPRTEIGPRPGADPDRHPGSSAASPLPRSAPGLRRRYLEDRPTIAILARELGCAIGTVRSALAAAAVPVRPSGPARKLGNLARDQAVLLVRQHGLHGAAVELGVSYGTFRAAVGWLEAGEEVARAGEAHDRERRRAGQDWTPLLKDRQALTQAYQTKGSARSPATCRSACARRYVTTTSKRSRHTADHLHALAMPMDTRA
jgi:hypothetical protein